MIAFNKSGEIRTEMTSCGDLMNFLARETFPWERSRQHSQKATMNRSVSVQFQRLGEQKKAAPGSPILAD